MSEFVRKIGSIGGSDVGSILGMSKYKTPAQAWDKIMGVATSADEPESPWTTRGTHLEQHIVRLYCHVTGRLVEERERSAHPTYTFLHCTADRYMPHSVGAPANGEGILEVKSLGQWTYKKIAEEGMAPAHYAQLQHYMFVAEKEWGAFAVMHADYAWILMLPEVEWDRPVVRAEIDKGFFYTDVLLDQEWLSEAIPKVVAWHEKYILANTRPPLLMDEADRIAPNVRRVGAEAEDWRDDPAWNNAVQTLKIAKAEASLTEHSLKLAEDKVKALMGDVEVALSKHGKISWKESTRRTFDHKTFLKQYPEYDSDEFYNSTASRSFRPTFQP